MSKCIEKDDGTHTARVVNGRVNRFVEKMSGPSGRTKRSLFCNLFQLMVLVQFLEGKFSTIFELWFSDRKKIASVYSNMDSERP